MLTGLFGKIMGYIVIIVTLALAPSIVTTNAAITAHANVSSNVLIGMSVVSAFGAPLIILGLLTTGGVFAVAGARGHLGGATAKDLLTVVGATIVAIVALTFMSTICTYVATLMGSYPIGTEFARTIFAIIPLIIYIGIIVTSGWTVVKTYRKAKSY